MPLPDNPSVDEVLAPIIASDTEVWKAPGNADRSLRCAQTAEGHHAVPGREGRAIAEVNLCGLYHDLLTTEEAT